MRKMWEDLDYEVSDSKVGMRWMVLVIGEGKKFSCDVIFLC